MNKDQISNAVNKFAELYNLRMKSTPLTDRDCFKLYEKHAPGTETAKIADSLELIKLCIPSDSNKAIDIEVNSKELYFIVEADLNKLGYELAKYR